MVLSQNYPGGIDDNGKCESGSHWLSDRQSKRAHTEGSYDGTAFLGYKKNRFGLLHSYCLIMHTYVLMFAFPFSWPSSVHLFDVCVCLKAARKMRRRRLMFHHIVCMIKLMESKLILGAKYTFL
jgi:hypothetical protein